MDKSNDKKRLERNTLKEVADALYEKYLVISQLASAREEELDYRIDEYELLEGIKVLLKEYYIALFTEDGSNLKLSFNNGQSFTLTVTENK